MQSVNSLELERLIFLFTILTGCLVMCLTSYLFISNTFRVVFNDLSKNKFESHLRVSNSGRETVLRKKKCLPTDEGG